SLLTQVPPASMPSVAAPGIDPELSSTEERVDETAVTGDGADGDASEIAVAQAPTTPSPTTPSDKSDIEGAPGSEEEDSDPWERLKRKVFQLNRTAGPLVIKAGREGLQRDGPRAVSGDVRERIRQHLVRAADGQQPAAGQVGWGPPRALAVPDQ